MKKKPDTFHSGLEWLAMSFFTLVLTTLAEVSFNIYLVNFSLLSVALILIGLGHYITREISRLEYATDKILIEENTLRVYLNLPGDEVVVPEHHGIIRHINTAAEWINGKLKSESASGIVKNEYPGSKDKPESLNENRDTVLLAGPELIDFNDYFSGQENRQEEKINKKVLTPVEPAGQLAGKEKTYKENPFQKEAQETLEEYKHSFNHSHDLICVVKPNGSLHRLNPNFEKTLGYSKNELLGKHFTSLVHPEDVELTLTAIDNLGTGEGSKNFINRYRRVDGSYSWLEWNISADSGNGKWYGIARDITNQKKAECEIDHLREQLDEKVFERTRQLETVNQELEAFTYSVSHDLHAPLRGVGSYAQILEEDYLNLLDEEGKRILLVIRSSAEKMGTLIDDLLAFSRLGKQSIQKTKVDLNECARGTLDELRQVYSHKATIQIHPLPSILCDGALSRQGTF